jgi:hypothetical protein
VEEMLRVEPKSPAILWLRVANDTLDPAELLLGLIQLAPRDVNVREVEAGVRLDLRIGECHGLCVLQAREVPLRRPIEVLDLGVDPTQRIARSRAHERITDPLGERHNLRDGFDRLGVVAEAREGQALHPADRHG